MQKTPDQENAGMTMTRKSRLTPFLLTVGSLLIVAFLLTTYLKPPLEASDTDARAETMITDFSTDPLDLGWPDLGWYVQNDNVMGGRSQGDFKQTQEELVFSGSTNTDGGGFSSIRTQPFRVDLSTYAGIRLQVKGDGRRYTWQLQTNASWRGRQISYWADFETSAGEWLKVDLPFSGFFPQFRGMKLDGPRLDPGEITEMGLYIYDKLDGPFEIHLSGVQAYPR